MGGYPKIAAVIEPDLWRIAQARPGDRVRFVRVNLAEADRADREMARELDVFRSGLAAMVAQQRSWA